MCIYVRVRARECVCVCVCACMCVYLCICICTCICACTYIVYEMYIYIYIYKYIYIYMYIYLELSFWTRFAHSASGHLFENNRGSTPIVQGWVCTNHGRHSSGNMRITGQSVTHMTRYISEKGQEPFLVHASGFFFPTFCLFESSLDMMQ